MAPKVRPLRERFEEKISCGPICWTWTAGKDKDGYGQIWVNQRIRRARAPRVQWWLTFGQIPKGKQVLHRCDNPACIRPSHLFLGTVNENNKDRARKGRSAVNINPRPGELNGNAKLTTLAVRQIREHAPHLTSADLAVLYGVKKVTIDKIRQHKAWRHVK